MSTKPVDNRVVKLTYDGTDFDPNIGRSEKAFTLFKHNVEKDGSGIVNALSSLNDKLSKRRRYCGHRD